jgi:hypothetical protein
MSSHLHGRLHPTAEEYLYSADFDNANNMTRSTFLEQYVESE